MIGKPQNSVLITGNGTYGFGQVPIKAPEKEQVLIKVEAATLNPSDILFMRGMYNVKLHYPYTPGWEGSGTVVMAGEGSSAATQALIGKRVAFMKSFEFGTYKDGGSFAEYCVTNGSQVFTVSDEMTFD
jgi:NADPH:quinone reductase-like Zn-dependent oxidoreductase